MCCSRISCCLLASLSSSLFCNTLAYSYKIRQLRGGKTKTAKTAVPRVQRWEGRSGANRGVMEAREERDWERSGTERGVGLREERDWERSGTDLVLIWIIFQHQIGNVVTPECSQTWKGGSNEWFAVLPCLWSLSEIMANSVLQTHQRTAALLNGTHLLILGTAYNEQQLWHTAARVPQSLGLCES